MTVCFLCSREVELDLTVRVDLEGETVDCCHECMTRGEDR